MFLVCKSASEIVEVKSNRAWLAFSPFHRFGDRNSFKCFIIDGLCGIAFWRLIGILAGIVMFCCLHNRIHFTPAIGLRSFVYDIPKHWLRISAYWVNDNRNDQLALAHFSPVRDRNSPLTPYKPLYGIADLLGRI